MAFDMEKRLHGLLSVHNPTESCVILETRRCADETPRQLVPRGQMLRKRADTESLGRIMSCINNRESVFLGVNRGPMRPFANDQSVDFRDQCFTERFR